MEKDAPEISTPACSAYDGLCTFNDVKAMLWAVQTHEELCALNDAVEERFVRDQQQLAMSDAEWHEYTSLVTVKASQLGQSIVELRGAEQASLAERPS